MSAAPIPDIRCAQSRRIMIFIWRHRYATATLWNLNFQIALLFPRWAHLRLSLRMKEFCNVDAPDRPKPTDFSSRADNSESVEIKVKNNTTTLNRWSEICVLITTTFFSFCRGDNKTSEKQRRRIMSRCVCGIKVKLCRGTLIGRRFFIIVYDFICSHCKLTSETTTY